MTHFRKIRVLLGAALLVAHDARQQAGHRLDDGHGSDLSTSENEVPDADLAAIQNLLREHRRKAVDLK